MAISAAFVGLSRVERSLWLQSTLVLLRSLAGGGLLCRRHLLADISCILGTLDIVFGKVDR
ncbi:hypothetical protein M446_4271 [Methylobacterium sp. 4-46]|nr:hypothetical protein M446_4271 [Methylobacterium sp. 4-46]